VALTLQQATLDGASYRGSVRGKLSFNPEAEVIVNDVIDVEVSASDAVPMCWYHPHHIGIRLAREQFR
jgi:hypothetical protein